MRWTRGRIWAGGAGMLVLSCWVLGIAHGRVSGAPVVSEVRSPGGVVVSVCPWASEAGIRILEAGGNAVDAAIAIEFVLAVTWPEAGNIGGGGFMMVHPGIHSRRDVVCIDYREVAPGAASRTFFTRKDTTLSHKAVGVPGTVRGMELAWRQFGSLPWAQLVEPAIKLAHEGFEVDSALASSINEALASGPVQQSGIHRELLKVYGKSNHAGGQTPWVPGDRIQLPDLAATLHSIATLGPDEFYVGRIARLIVQEMQTGDGAITSEDLKNYRAILRSPIHGKYQDYDVYGPPPPSSGGICIMEMLNTLAAADTGWASWDDAGFQHVLAETMKFTFADRARHLGDSDFVAIPQWLTHQDYARLQATRIHPERATPSTEIAPDIPIRHESPHTTHFSVVDRHGMAVSNTTTLEASWGARIVVTGAGFVLNNEMGDFNWFPGETNQSGRIGTEPNTIAPGKRMLSSMSPVIVSHKGSVVLVTGSPGGRTIINTVLQMILAHLRFHLPLDQAMSLPRFHHQWLPDRLRIENLENPTYTPRVEALRALGHNIHSGNHGQSQGDAHSISIDTSSGLRHGVADFRRRGAALSETQTSTTTPQQP